MVSTSFSLLLYRVNSTIVNELSNTIDLESTLIRAEALFRRFQRTVEAIDKKHNFPIPSVRQRRPAEIESDAGPSTSSKPVASSSSSDAKKQQSHGGAADKPTDAAKEKVISPELRALLSREVQKLDKGDIKEHGGSVSNPA